MDAPFDLQGHIIKFNGESVESDADNAPCASEMCQGWGRVSIDDLADGIDECNWCR